MAYASAADFIAAFGESEWLQLTDRDRDEITDTGVGTAALETAAGIVDGYASGIYALPLNVVDVVIRQITLDWRAGFCLEMRRLTVSPKVTKRQNRRLNDIASG